MTAPKGPKKSETLEVRLPHETKAAFMARCRHDGQTASEAVRGFIETELAADVPSPGPGKRLWHVVAAAAAGLALGAVAAPSLAHTTSVDQAAFERLDRNHDGALSLAEFQRH